MCTKKDIGSAAVVMHRHVISDMLRHNHNSAFDWGFSAYFTDADIRMLVPEHSMACHFGVVGTHSSPGHLKELAYMFDMSAQPKWVALYLDYVLKQK